MPQNIKRFLVTGMPGSGKTTLIKKVTSELSVPFHGFFTGEIKAHGQRRGFEIESFFGERAIMAHVDIISPYKVGKYGVDIGAFETIALPEMEAAVKERCLLILDEIGKMELFSEKFKKLLLEVFYSNIIIVASIMSRPNPFCDRLKSSSGTESFFLARENGDAILKRIMESLHEIRFT